MAWEHRAVYESVQTATVLLATKRVCRTLAEALAQAIREGIVINGADTLPHADEWQVVVREICTVKPEHPADKAIIKLHGRIGLWARRLSWQRKHRLAELIVDTFGEVAQVFGAEQAEDGSHDGSPS